VAFGGANWFALDDPGAPDCSVGWHEARVLGSLDGGLAQYEFYIDGLLSKTATSTVTDLFNWIVMGSGLISPPWMPGGSPANSKCVVLAPPTKS
jgi:hypothetical protein